MADLASPSSVALAEVRSGSPVNPARPLEVPMAHLAHALLCDACSDPIPDDEEPIVVPGPGPVEHFHRDPDCAGGTPCENHPDLPACGAAQMPSADRPYHRNVPLCGPCLKRIAAIGFPTTEEVGRVR